MSTHVIHHTNTYPLTRVKFWRIISSSWPHWIHWTNNRRTYLVCIGYLSFTTFRTINRTLSDHLSVWLKNCPIDWQNVCPQWKRVYKITVKLFTRIVVLTVCGSKNSVNFWIVLNLNLFLKLFYQNFWFL